MPHPPHRILILTGSIGSGHLSVARAIADAIYRMKNVRVNVEIVDLITELRNFATTATKKIYLESLKISPKLYEFLFSSTADKEWPTRLLNHLSAPFIQRKLMKLIIKKEPNVLVSTFPVWDFIIKKIWKKYINESGKKNLPFVSVITDSISIHSSWIIGHPNFFIVPNEDTRISLRNLGVPSKRIKTFGYPVAHCFFTHPSINEFQKKWNVSPKRKTILLILSDGVRWNKVEDVITAIKRSSLKNFQLVIIAGSNSEWREKLSKIKWPWPTHITGWTNEIHTFIHAVDIVLTKAGGSTIMECITCKKPIVIFEAIPGQEIGNATLVQKYHLGVVLNSSLNDFDEAITHIIKNEALIKKNLVAEQKPHAADDIAKFLASIAKS